MHSSKANLKIKSSTILNEPNGIYYLKIYPLQSGKILTENINGSKIYYSIYDLTSQTKLTTYQHHTLRSYDHYTCYLPEGPVLKPFNETLDLSLIQLFEFRLAVYYPDYYWKLHKPICKIAYLDNNTFVVLNEDTFFFKKTVFDLFSMQNETIKKIGKIRNYKFLLQNLFFNISSHYTSKNTDQIFSTTGEWICIIHKKNQLDIWKKTSKKTFELYASFDIQEKIQRKNFNFSVACLAITLDDMLICQVKHEHFFVCLIKINLREKKLCASASISRDYIDAEVDNFYGLQSISPINNANLYIGKTYFTDETYLIDINCLSVQKLLLPYDFRRPVISAQGEVITHNSQNHSIDSISLPYIENYLDTQKMILQKEQQTIIYKFLYPLDIVNIVSQYNDDYSTGTSKKYKSESIDLSDPSIRRFSFFYKNPDWIDRTIDSPLEFIERKISHCEY